MTNPTPQQSKWLAEHTGLNRYEVQQAFSIHAIYQFFGRTAIRVRGNTNTVLLMCAGQRDALFMHKLFEGSRFIGQIGKLPSTKALPQYSKPKAKVVRLTEYPEYKASADKVRNLRKLVARGTAHQAELDAAIAHRDDLKARLRAVA